MQLPWRDVPVGDGTISTSITDAEITKLQELASGCCVLEIGSAYGYSAIRMSETALHVLAVDPHTGHDSLYDMRGNVLRWAQSPVSILWAPSHEAFALLRGCGARFGLVFIDGDHSEQAVRDDVLNAQRVLGHGGAIACHDFGEVSCAGVTSALSSLYPAGPSELVDTLFVIRP